MTRDEFIKMVSEIYGVNAEFPWFDYPNYAVFRHAQNAKWFAVLMDVKSEKIISRVRSENSDENGEILGVNALLNLLENHDKIDIINLKFSEKFAGECGFLGEMIESDALFSAYHMNKKHWLSVALDLAQPRLVRNLLGMSFELTQKKSRKK